MSFVKPQQVIETLRTTRAQESFPHLPPISFRRPPPFPPHSSHSFFVSFSFHTLQFYFPGLYSHFCTCPFSLAATVCFLFFFFVFLFSFLCFLHFPFVSFCHFLCFLFLSFNSFLIIFSLFLSFFIFFFSSSSFLFISQGYVFPKLSSSPSLSLLSSSPRPTIPL